MAHELPELPYAQDALAPHISAETLQYHHGKHHAGYVSKLNAALEGSDLASLGLEELIREAKGNAKIFNSAAQHFNHSFYWKSLSPNGGGKPTGKLADAIERDFGSFEEFKKAFTNVCATHFGSGWGWLVKNAEGQLQVVGTHDADSPVAHNLTPLLTCDVWEHAYYVDYRNARGTYIESFWKLVDWNFVASNL